MVYFYSGLILIWTLLFATVFVSNAKKDPPPQQVKAQAFQEVTLQRNCPQPLSLFPTEPQKEEKKEEYVPVQKGSTIPVLVTKTEEITEPVNKIEVSVEDGIRTLIENRLVSILVRVNIAACTKCTASDKKIILQLKMAKALTEGNVKLAQYYSDAMNKYLKGKEELKWIPKD